MAVNVNVESTDSLPDDEPKLKYDRMGNDLQNILLKDAVSCICVHPKFICLGTQWGVIHLLDHEGNIVPISQDGKTKELQAHTIAVNQISVDLNGDYIASCSDDGKVLVYGLYSDDNTHSITVGRSVKSIALDPYYFKSGSGRRFFTGDTKLTLYEKTFLSRVRSTVVCECEGAVQAMAWHERWLAWASEVGVRVYDAGARASLGLIQWERAAGHRCNLAWAPRRTLMIGWADTVRVCRVRRRAPGAAEFLVDPVHTVQTDYLISGLAPLGERLVLLGLPKDGDAEPAAAPRPVLVVADYRDCEFCEVSTDTLNVRGYEAYASDDYRLDVLADENRFFIVSPKDIVVASPYELDDRVAWLTEHRRFERALGVLEAAGGRSARHSLATVGAQYLDHLLAQRALDEAAVLCARVCKADRALWETQLLKFAELNQLRAVSAYVPRQPEQALAPHVYELIFVEFLKEDPPGFLRLVREWSPALYKTGVIVNKVLEHLLPPPPAAARERRPLSDADKNVYLEALALLYCHQRKYDKALTTYLRIGHRAAFDLIAEHKMYDVIHDKILELMTLDADRAVAVLLGKEARVPAAVVERQLAGRDLLLLRYLDAYVKLEPNGAHNDRLVSLYAEHARAKLLPFLRSSDSYHIQRALDECRARALHAETVFLLGRIGSTREALQVIVERLGDVPQAIHFCQEHDDRELWGELVARTVHAPEHVTLLLERIGNYADPRVLLQSVAPGRRIAGLKRSLAKMMSDYRLQLSVRAACRAVALRDYFELHEKLVATRRRGAAVGDELACCACARRVLARDAELLVFPCRHCFHRACAPDQRHCAVCSAAALP